MARAQRATRPLPHGRPDSHMNQGTGAQAWHLVLWGGRVETACLPRFQRHGAHVAAKDVPRRGAGENPNASAG